MPDAADGGPVYARDWDPQGRPRPGEEPDYERKSKTRPGWVLAVVGMLALTGIIIHFSLAALLGSFERHRANWTLDPQYLSPLTNGRLQVPPPPRLQTGPEDDLNTLRAQEAATLDTYGWADRQRGVVRLPVERAKELILRRGLPRVPGASTEPRLDALRAAPFPNGAVLLGGETPAEGRPGSGS